MKMPETNIHLLIAVLGRTPQVLTETLYALCEGLKIPITEAWVISTQEGYEEAIKRLIHPTAGEFYRLQKDFPTTCGQIRFSEKNILVARDEVMPIPDIRTRQHSENFLELIMKVLWEKTNSTNTTLHCSLAGGRKTMSTYLALGLQLLGRMQDRLYHVLVDPPELEHHPEFYYPSPQQTILSLSNGVKIDSSKAQIDLVDIPFVRLRERLQINRMSEPLGYRQLLEWAQSDINQALILPTLKIDPSTQRIIIGDTEIRMQPQRFCLYWYFADRSRTRPPQIATEDYTSYFEFSLSPYFGQEMLTSLLRRFDVVDPEGKMRRNFMEKVLEDSQLPMSWVLQTISRINSQIRLCLPKAYLLPFYLISSHGKRGNKCYGIKLDGQKIVSSGLPP